MKRLWAALAAGLGLIIAFAASYLTGRGRGRSDQRREHEENTHEGFKDGQERKRDSDTAGIQPDQRLRENDGRWL